MKKYNLINNSLGWLCFAIAAVTYLMTLEPTASFWDCPEFISQGFKLEVGHPPGNPIFMLAARFCITIGELFGASPALSVNAMSGLLSAGTILLLFWSITHLAKRLLVKDNETEISTAKMIAIFGSGICGALAYTWSDTFWYSAVEGEVYAFSSFCTALVFWLILKWENRADQPHSDRYLILIAYVIGISIAVHLLNLLCVPAIVLVIYYRKFKNTTATGSLIALAISAVIVGLILYGLVPGFVKVAQGFDIVFVNYFGLSFNSGVITYVGIFLATFVWCIYELYRQTSPVRIKISFILSILLSGIPMIGGYWMILVIVPALIVYLFVFFKREHTRILSVTATSILVMFIGYSSYALLLIRSDANPPINQNSPDNVFALGSYLNREQYGDRPLGYGPTLGISLKSTKDEQGISKLDMSQGAPQIETQDILYIKDTVIIDGYPYVISEPLVKEYKTTWSKRVKESPDDPDRYVFIETPEYKTIPELNMLFPRMYSNRHTDQYLSWIEISPSDLIKPEYADQYENVTLIKGMPNMGYYDSIGNDERINVFIPSFWQNLKYFINYQLNHMYLRYFMWNFAGRQNDIQGNGEPNHGNWVSGIAPLDEWRLGDQSLLPYDEGEGNKGHNVFYMLPLLMGIIGLLWQAFSDKRGIEQFWVIFFLFFMTGIAIVIYLNQTPGQPRERDYAFAGSFYAFAIWIGLGVAALWRIFIGFNDKNLSKGNSITYSCIAALIGLLIPLQMVSQTWDDHDRSGRYTARDFGMNYLSSVGENGIIFVNGDNDTFPLWYAQEVEGYRTDVRVINLSYLTTDWYANQQLIPAYDAPAVDMQSRPIDYANNRRQVAYIDGNTYPVLRSVSEELDSIYHPRAFNKKKNRVIIPSSYLYIPVNTDSSMLAEKFGEAFDFYPVEPIIDLSSVGRYGVLDLSEILTLDIVNKSAENDWERPVYFAMTVSDNYYLTLDKYMLNTGVAYQVTPLSTNNGGNIPSDTERMYKNVTEKFRWGGLDQGEDIYLDETVRRMVSTHRMALLTLAQDLNSEGHYYANLAESNDLSEAEKLYLTKKSQDKFHKSGEIINLLIEKLPERLCPYSSTLGSDIGRIAYETGSVLNDTELMDLGHDMIKSQIIRYASYQPYFDNLSRKGMLYRLKSFDRLYIPVILYRAMTDYSDCDGDMEALADELESRDLSTDRFIEQYYPNNW